MTFLSPSMRQVMNTSPFSILNAIYLVVHDVGLQLGGVYGWMAHILGGNMWMVRCAHVLQDKLTWFKWAITGKSN